MLPSIFIVVFVFYSLLTVALTELDKLPVRYSNNLNADDLIPEDNQLINASIYANGVPSNSGTWFIQSIRRASYVLQIANRYSNADKAVYKRTADLTNGKWIFQEWFKCTD